MRDFTNSLSDADIVSKIFAKDPGLWSSDISTHNEIRNRLGWVDCVDAMLSQTDEITDWAKTIQDKGVRHVVLLGMGGSSLAPEVIFKTFDPPQNTPDLLVLDNTAPASVASVKKLDLEKSLFIVASKSGGTIETNAFFRYFYDYLKQAIQQDAGSHFVAITDAGTSLEELARQHRFEKIFINPSNIGGRFSALSLFGLVPAALIGVDIKKFLQIAKEQMSQCRQTSIKRNEALKLGRFLAESAAVGRDKMTLIVEEKCSSLGVWVEQLVAESTGKQSLGVIPVIDEKPRAEASYGVDRCFVFEQANQNSKLAPSITNLKQHGHPVMEMTITDAYQLGAVFYRWEFATAVAGACLGINPFDEPNVTEAKQTTNSILQGGQIASEADCIVESDMGHNDLVGRLKRLFETIKPADYVTVLSYLSAHPETDQVIKQLREVIGKRLGIAVCLGVGPRYLHSTGQLHKGGPNSGVYMVITSEHTLEENIPDMGYTFARLNHAQSFGDAMTLRHRDRRVLHFHVNQPLASGLNLILRAAAQALHEMSSPCGLTVSILSWEPNAPVLSKIRKQVFVYEQSVPEELELDGLDADATHVAAYDGEGAVIGTARIQPDGKIGRMAVLLEWRNKGVGGRMLEALLNWSKQAGYSKVHLSAQIQAVGFYREFGFVPIGEPYEEAGIQHQAMTKILS